MKRIVLDTTRAIAEHCREVTEALREEEPPLGLALDEAICPVCRLAYLVPALGTSWGVCSECLTAAIERLPKD